jgi:hypothetical protein
MLIGSGDIGEYRPLEAPHASLAKRRGSETTSDLPNHLRLSYADFGIFALLSDISAVVFASIAAGGVYHWFAFGRAERLEDFWGLGLLLAALTAILMKLRGLYPVAPL